MDSNEPIDFSQSTLINADCISVLNTIPDNSVDCVLTDPPYNLGLFMHARNTNLNKMRENQFAYAGWDNLEFEEWRNNMKSFFDDDFHFEFSKSWFCH